MLKILLIIPFTKNLSTVRPQLLRLLGPKKAIEKLVPMI